MSDYDDDDGGYEDYEDTPDDPADLDILPETTPNATTRQASFKNLTPEDLMEAQRQEVLAVSSILNTSLFTAGTLLRKFRWDKSRLLEAYYADPDRVCRDAGVSTVATSVPTHATVAKPEHCGVCYCTDEPMEALECGHFFCHDCWKTYLTLKITEEGYSCIVTHCQAFKCQIVVDDVLVKKMVDAHIYEKYAAFLARSFVDDNPAIHWCPAPNCGRAVHCESGAQAREVLCACGFRFCFACKDSAHLPSSCEQVKKWLIKCKDDSETYNWILANTKDCPQCKSCIEKNGGCNHMECKQCHHHFCWVCSGPWKDHGTAYYQCNRYEGKDDKSSDKENSKAALERYLHYYTRYMNHNQSLGLEGQTRAKLDAKVLELQKQDKAWIDVQYIGQAALQLRECRRTLMYTYVFAYYLSEGPEKKLFEFLQEELEHSTETLSGLLEVPVDQLDRPKIVNMTRITELRLRNLLEGVQSGLTTQGGSAGAAVAPVVQAPVAITSAPAPAPSSTPNTAPAPLPPQVLPPGQVTPTKRLRSRTKKQ